MGDETALTVDGDISGSNSRSHVLDIYPLNCYYFGSKQALSLNDETIADRVDRMKSNYAAHGLRTCVEAVILGQWPAIIPKDDRGQKVTCTAECLLTAPMPRWRRRQLMVSYQPRRKGMAESATHSLKQQTSSHVLSSGIKENTVVLCSHRAPAAVLTVLVLTEVSRSGGQSYTQAAVELFKHPHVLLLQVRNCVFKLPGGRLRPGESEIDGLKRKLARKLSIDEEGSGLDWEVGECLGMWWRPDFETLLYPYLPPNVKKPKECIKLFLVKLPASRRFTVPRNFKLLAVPLCQIHEDHKTYGPIISGVPQLLSKFSFNIIEP
ncbi:homolog of CFIM-25 [Actinidia rufa]|uniref:Homolog of CFIM-25 n=1 Tax=Actinidia rufa TaxID=165716 RepID=A0A7J0E1V4_9ERIC|nr:homolog of CFIM-25 [Actinidia rufa]